MPIQISKESFERAQRVMEQAISLGENSVHLNVGSVIIEAVRSVFVPPYVKVQGEIASIDTKDLEPETIRLLLQYLDLLNITPLGSEKNE